MLPSNYKADSDTNVIFISVGIISSLVLSREETVSQTTLKESSDNIYSLPKDY
jgi:hypothetical protein